MSGKRSKTVSREEYEKVRLQRDEYHSKWLTAAKELSALRAITDELQDAHGELKSARYVLAAFCKANGGEAYISPHTLATLSQNDRIERRDEPDGGIYYRLSSGDSQ